MNVLIAGAGIGGLCAALCLQKAGHKVQLFEKSTQLTEIGAGIQLGANALCVLDYLGVLSDLESKSVAPERVDFCSFKSAEVLYSAKLGESYVEKYGAPYLHVHRADLQAVLLKALGPQTQLHYNCELATYAETEHSVEIELQNGRRYEGDCLVAADGIKSVVRRNFTQHEASTFTGNVAWRGVVAANRLPDDFMQKVVQNFVGPNKHMVMYYLRKQQLVNFVGVVEDKKWTDDSWTQQAPWEKLKQDFSGWHPTVQALIDAMQGQDCYRWALHQHKPFRNWSSKRVTLLGDAAHATLPFLASGAAMSIEDGRILQRALAQSDTVSAGLQLYQRNRFDRTAKIQRLSSKMSKLYHISHPVLLKLAFKAIKLKSVETEAFISSYDANQVELL